jgi:hypothetical protein
VATFDQADQFRRDYARLTREQKRGFVESVKKFNADLDAGATIRSSLRVSPLKGAPGIFELSYEGNDGRATFEYGPDGSVVEGKKHIIWRRVGTHGVFDRP